MAVSIDWKRNIDLIELSDKRVKVYCKNGNVYTGRGIGDCQGTDENGEDVDGVRFETDSGFEIDFIEDDIEKIEFLD